MDRYLVEFQEVGKDYFKTDCGFREGQLDLAQQYVRLIVGNLKHIVAGRVLDYTTKVFVYTLRPQSKLAVNVEMHLHGLLCNLATVEGCALPAEQVEAIKQRMVASCATQIAELMCP